MPTNIYYEENSYGEGEHKAMMRATGLRVYKGKTLEQLSEAECKEAREYIRRVAGVSYYWG